MWLFAIFVAVPIIEIALFIQVGGFIGLFPTLAIVILTALLGTYLVRQQGALALSQLRNSFNELQDPSEPLAHGAMILFSGALLLTPGFFTDAVGFLLLIPRVREILFREVRSRVTVKSFSVNSQSSVQTEHSSTTQARPNQAGPIIDGEFEELSDEESTNKGSSGWTRH